MRLRSVVLVLALAVALVAILLTAVGAADNEAAEAASASGDRRPGDDFEALDQLLQAEGWEFVGDVFHDPVVPEADDEAFVVLGNGHGYRRAGFDSRDAEPPLTAGGIPADFDPFNRGQGNRGQGLDLGVLAGQTPGPVTPAPLDTIISPAEPLGVILGPTDDRLLVFPLLLNKYPLRTVGSLSGNPNGGTGCTGTLIGPRHVLTAAHCLYNANGWFSPIYFNPGQYGDEDANGAPRPVVAMYARTFALSADYGVAILEDNPSTASLGWMGMWWYDPLEIYTDKAVLNHGYPLKNNQCAGSPLFDGTCGGFMYADACNVAVPTDGYLMYDCDTQGGHSGSAIWRWIDGEPAVVAVHKRGNEPSSGAVVTDSPATLNLGPRVRPTLFNDVCEWMGNHPSAFASHAFCAP